MRDRLLAIANTLEQMHVSGERNALIYLTCLRELRAAADGLGQEGAKAHGDLHTES